MLSPLASALLSPLSSAIRQGLASTGLLANARRTLLQRAVLETGSDACSGSTLAHRDMSSGSDVKADQGPETSAQPPEEPTSTSPQAEGTEAAASREGTEAAPSGEGAEAEAAPSPSPSARPTPTGMRSLSDVLGHNIKITPPSTVLPEVGEVIDAYDPFASEDVSLSSAEAASEPDPALELIDPKYGFSILGGVMPQQDSTEALYTVHPRVHPKHSFTPGQAYAPGDLNPLSSQDDGPSRFGKRRERIMPSVYDVKTNADYKNVQFLEKFLSPAGRMLSRKDTKLPVGLHVHVMRQIKIARNMGLIAGEARLDKLHVRKMREMGITSLDDVAWAKKPETPGTSPSA